MTRTTINILCVLLLVSGIAWAQVTTGTISGTVSDETGGVLPGVEVTVTNTDTGGVRAVVTDDAGRYSAPNLTLGNYEVSAGLTGFQTGVRSGIKLTVGREAIIDISLRIGEISERVVVEGEAPLVEATSSTVVGLVDDKKIRDLPLNGRSFTQLAALQEGVAPPRHFENIQPGNEGDKLSISGTRITQTAFLLDGTDIRNNFGTTPGSVAGVLLGVDTVREFSVVTTGASAEYGIFTGGVINAVSRSGTNELHGSLFEFHRNSALDARNFFDRDPTNPLERSKTPHFVRNQFGFTVGGPIVKDKTFFFGSYEGLRDRLTVTRTARVPTANGRQGIFPNGTFNFLTRQFTTQIPVSPDAEPFLDDYPLPNGETFSDETGFFRFGDAIPTDEDYFMVKIDHNFSDSHSFFARYTFDDSEKNPFLFSGIGPQGRGWEEFSTTRFQVFTVKNQNVVSPTLINDFHFGFMRSNVLSDSRPIINVDESVKQMRLPDRTWGAIFGGNIQGWGPSELTHLDMPLNRFEFGDTVVLTKGRHSLKFGAKITRLQFNILNGVFAHGTAVMINYTNFLQAQPIVMLSKLGDIDPEGDLPAGFERNVGGPLIRLGYRETILGFFVQDDFKWTPNLTLNLGLRYEFYKNPTEEGGRIGDIALPSETTVRLGNPVLSRNPSKRNFAPRIGLAWDPFGDGKMSIRAAGGIFFDLLESGRLLGPQTQFPFHSKVTTFFPQWPNFLDTIRQRGLGGIKDAPFVYGTPNQSYIAQYNLTIQRELFPDAVLTVGYAGSRGIKLSRLQDVNIAPVTVKDGRYFWPAGSKRANQTFDQMRMYLWDANSFFNSLRVGFQKRFSHGFQFQSSYTWSKAVDEASNTANFDAAGGGPNGTNQVPFDRKVDRARASFDIRHVYSANFTVELPFGPGKPLGGGSTGAAAKLIGGWQLSGLLSLNTGPPLTVALGFDRAGMDNSADISQRPDLVPGADPSPVLNDGREPAEYFDVSSFRLPPIEAADGTPGGFWGTAPRNSVDGPGVAVFDFAVLKDTKISEDINLQFRAEFFNIFNRGNWRGPSRANIFPSPGPPVKAAAAITTTSTTSRQIQFALKIVF
ncbi:TonB-dependent receptor [Acidobacteria bacterium AH-259-D05]|nr:TonB-dependent receptor [Acidobacteria bacterium AH-259-D05]